MTDFFHEADETRLVHYEGCFWNPDFAHVSDMIGRMYAKPAEIDRILADKPAKPYISCWRAMTDNDRGCKHGFDRGVWLPAGLYLKMVGGNVIEGENEVTVIMEHELPMVGVRQTMAYTVTGDGAIRVEATYHGKAGLPSLPAYGVHFKLKERYHNFRCYDYGPDENYN